MPRDKSFICPLVDKVLDSGIFRLKEVPENDIDLRGLSRVCGQIWLWLWSDIGQIFGQNWSDSQSDFWEFWSDLEIIYTAWEQKARLMSGKKECFFIG